VYTFRKHGTHVRVHGTRPCRHALNTAVFTVRTRLCTRAVCTPVYMVHSRTRPCSGHGRTMYMAHARSCTQSVHGPGHVPCTWAAMYTGREHGRVLCTRPCLRPARVYGRARPCTDCVHGRARAMLHSPSMTRTRPCSQRVRTVYAMHTRHRKS